MKISSGFRLIQHFQLQTPIRNPLIPRCEMKMVYRIPLTLFSNENSLSKSVDTPFSNETDQSKPVDTPFSNESVLSKSVDTMISNENALSKSVDTLFPNENGCSTLFYIVFSNEEIENEHIKHSFLNKKHSKI
jgi:hypothetical protein